MIEHCDWCKSRYNVGFFDDYDNSKNNNPLRFPFPGRQNFLGLGKKFCSQKCRYEWEASQGRNHSGDFGGIITASDLAQLKVICLVCLFGLSGMIVWLIVTSIFTSSENQSNLQSPIQTPIKTINPAYRKYMRLGYQSTTAKNYEDAIANFRKALAIVPNDSNALKAIQNVSIYIADKKYKELMGLGYSLVKSNDSLGAIETFKKALEYKPNERKGIDALANMRYAEYMQLGTKLVQEKSHKAAFITFEMALKNRPKDPHAIQSMQNAATLMASSIVKAGLTPNVATKPQNITQVGLYVDLASQMEQQQNFEDSFIIFEKAFQDNPSNQSIRLAFQKTAKSLAANHIRK